jgi:hypothetical protein
MTKKDLNPQSMVNELKGHSVYFNEKKANTLKRGSTPVKKGTENIQEMQNNNVRSNEGPNERKFERSSVRRRRRVKIRHTFDIFEDQLRELHSIQLKAIQSGKKRPKIGSMVQKALDSYLACQSQSLNGIKTNVRTNQQSNEGTKERI